MGRQVDLDDIIDSAGVAELLGLSQSKNVSVYRSRYRNDGFPEPVLNLGNGRCLLWLKSEVIEWRRSRS